MSDEVNKISGNNGEEQQKLIRYLNKDMADEEQHEFEKNIDDDAFMYDAVEGLEQIDNKGNLQLLVQQLNNGLKKQISKKNKRKEKRRLKEQPWIYFTIILLLLLIIIAYLVIKKF